MPSLVIIEAPGKRAALTKVLRGAGLWDVEVLATGGHIGSNPSSLRPVAIDSSYRETAYQLKAEKRTAADAITQAVERAQRIYLATDDDQEGDVIARDVLAFCVPPEAQERVLRLRLKALAVDEVKAALASACPLDPLAAARGDARRIVDRLIGSLSSADAAVGRVQGSLLLMLREHAPVAGVMTYRLPSDDGRGDWVARVPIAAGQEVPAHPAVGGWKVGVGRTERGVMARAAMNYEQIVLSASVATGAGVGEVSDAMQRLYEGGRMTYPRSRDGAVTAEAVRRVAAIAHRNGATFDQGLVRAVRLPGQEHGHEAPNPAVLDVPINRAFGQMGLDDQVLVHITRRLVDCGTPCTVETPRLVDLARLPEGLPMAGWSRVTPIGLRLWEEAAEPPGFKAWTPGQSLVHFMAHHGLGRPSTCIDHVSKFLTRGLVSQEFELTAKGREWAGVIGEMFEHRNISSMIEAYIACNRKDPCAMVEDMVKMCGIDTSTSTILQLREPAGDEEYEIYSG